MEYKFSSKSIPQVFIDLIRDLVYRKSKDKNKDKEKAFLAEESSLLIKYLNNFCDDLKELLSSEDRVIRLNSPVVVIGDIGGHLKDLIRLERQLWPSFPVVSSNHLFLGNWFGSGPRGVECVIYVLAIKLIAPNKVFLLRGSRETIDSKNFFKKECIEKYGQKTGEKVWNLLNDVFDNIPIAVVVDEHIFCANGGIPRKTTNIEDIYSVPPELKNPKESAIAYEVIDCCESSFSDRSSTDHKQRAADQRLGSGSHRWICRQHESRTGLLVRCRGGETFSDREPDDSCDSVQQYL